MDEAEKYPAAQLTFEKFEKEILPRLLAMDTSFLFYQDGNLRTVNANFCRQFKYALSGPAAANEGLWRESGDRARFQENVTECLAGRKVESGEYRVFDGEGRAVRARIHFIPFAFTDHEPICACALTDETSIEQILKVMENCGDDIFELIAEQSLNGIGLVDNRFRLFYMNPAGLAIYGFKNLEEAQNTPIINTIAPEHMNLIVERARNWMRGEPNEPRLITKIVRPDGEIRDLEVQTSNIYRKGQLYRLNTFIDITERLKVEAALRESEERSRAQYKGIPVPTYTWRRVDDDFVLAEFNDAAVAITQGNIQKFVGKRATEMYAGQPEIQEDIRRCFREQAAIVREMPYHYQSTGQVKRLVVKYAPITPDSVLVHTEDITDRKRAEDALRRSEARFRTAAQCASDLIYEWDMESRQLKWFGDVDAIFGYAPGEFPRDLDEYNQLLHPDDRERILASVRESLTTGKPYSEEYRVRKKDGEYLDITSRGTVVLDDKGMLERWIGAISDITQRKRAEEALHRSEERFRTAAQIGSDLIFEWNSKTLQFVWYGDVDSVFGYGPGEFPRDLFEGNKLIHHDDRKRVFEAMARTLRTGEPFHLEYRVRRKDGSYSVVSSRGVAIPESDGKNFHWIGINTEITERKKAEDALRESERKYRLLAENVSDVIWTVNQKWELTYVSPSVKAIAGYSPEELIGLTPEKILSPQILAAAREAFKRTLKEAKEASGENPEGGTVEVPLQNKDGAIFWTEIKWAFLRDDSGAVIGIQGVARDITKRKKAELALEESERRLRLALKEEVRHTRSKDHLQFWGADATYHQYPSSAMRQMLEEARIAAHSDGNLLLLGKSGVGKNFLAGWIHQHSSRADGPFFDINCSSIPATLIESELFGHEAGAFTGSVGTKRGLLELAEGGTLFLDEIGDMDFTLQTRLLQFLDTRMIRRVGGGKSIQVNARIIAATNRDLETLVRENRFREDLYYRLNVLSIRVPALSERREDLPILAGEIIRRLALDMGLKKPPVLSPEVLKAVTRYSWPGNVRELKNVLERMLLAAEDKTIISDTSLILTQNNRAFSLTITETGKIMETGQAMNLKNAARDMIKKLIEDALAKAETKQKAAAILGISRHALYRQMRKLKINERK